jgi:hypothetical protein
LAEARNIPRGERFGAFTEINSAPLEKTFAAGNVLAQGKVVIEPAEKTRKRLACQKLENERCVLAFLGVEKSHDPIGKRLLGTLFFPAA